MKEHMKQCLEERAENTKEKFLSASIVIENDKIIRRQNDGTEYIYKWEEELYQETITLEKTFYCFSHYSGGRFAGYELSSQKEKLYTSFYGRRKTLSIEVSSGFRDINLVYEMLLAMIRFIKTKSKYRVKILTGEMELKLSDKTLNFLTKMKKLTSEILSLINNKGVHCK